jgi:hypothetical protein
VSAQRDVEDRTTAGPVHAPETGEVVAPETVTARQGAGPEAPRAPANGSAAAERARGIEAGLSTWVDVDEEGRYVAAPDEALAMFGVTPDELRQHRVGDFAPSGLGPIHRALFLWVVRSGEDFGGGQSTIVSRDGVATPVDCTEIERRADCYRVVMTVGSGEPGSVYTDSIAAVLEAWRKAERKIAAGDWQPDYEIARNAAAALSEVYQAVASAKSATTEWATDRFEG